MEEAESPENDQELSKAERKAAKKEAKQAKKEEKKKQKYEQDEDDIDSGIAIEDEEPYSDKLEKNPAGNVREPENLEDAIEIEVVEEALKKQNTPLMDLEEREVESLPTEQEEEAEPTPKKKSLRKSAKAVPYGDEPTFGTDKESESGFYGGEIEEEDEVFIDIIDDGYDEDLESEPSEEDLKVEPSEEEDLKATMKSLLPDEQNDDEDDDDDFEFIDLN